MALKDTEYMYASSRIKAREGALSYYDKLSAYLECKSVSELYELVLGAEHTSEAQKEAIEYALDKKISDAFELVGQIAPRKEYFNFLLYEYDCCNLKALIKCSLRSVSPDGILYSYSTVSEDALKEAVIKRNFDVLPQNMALAANEAIDAYAKTSDPKMIDMIIDKACFADMVENASLSKCKMFEELVRSRIDIINILTLVRIFKSDIADKKSVFSEAFLYGGEIEEKTFISVFEKEEMDLNIVLSGTKYKYAIEKLGESWSSSKLERELDGIYLSIIKDVKFVPFGPEVLCSYIVNTIYEVKNIRIILAGLSSSLPQEKIRERVRF